MFNEPKDSYNSRPVVCPSCGSTNMVTHEDGLSSLDGFEILSLIIISCALGLISGFCIFKVLDYLVFDNSQGVVAFVVVFLICLFVAAYVTYTLIMAHVKERHIRDGICVKRVTCNSCHLTMRVVRPRVFSDDAACSLTDSHSES